MEIGIDSFAATFGEKESDGKSNAKVIGLRLDRIELADKVGLDVFGMGDITG